MQPLVSLVTAIYNREQYIAQAIESVLAQSEPNFELILLDDGSTDRSVEVAQQYAQADQRIRLIKAKHQGQGLALNTAYSFASGKYLAQLDSDDWLAPDAFAETVAVLEAVPEAVMVYSNYYDVNETGSVLHLGHRCHIPYSKERLLLDLMVFHFRLFRREAFEQVGGIDPQYECAPDYDLSLKLSEIGEVVHLEKALYFYRRHANSISSAKQLEQIRYSHRAVASALKRRNLTEHISVEVQLRPKLVFKRNATPAKNSLEQKAKVFGIGLGKTGTASLRMALEILGYRTTHSLAIDSLQAYDAAADSSVAMAFRELDWRYPDARFILTVRPVETWLAAWKKYEQENWKRSSKGKATPTPEEGATPTPSGLPDNARALRVRVFGQHEFDEAVWQRAYWRHYQEVTDYFKGRSQQLLIYELCRTQSWEPLCAFLDAATPAEPFPHRR